MLIVDDSALVRAVLTEILTSDHRLRVVGSAQDAYEARELIKQHNPDVITLDVEMPKMNGIAFLRNLMRLRPMPVVMISTLTQQGAPATLEALELGAVDFLPKPRMESSEDLEGYRQIICEKVYQAARSKVRVALSQSRATPARQRVDQLVAQVAQRQPRRDCIIAIGASTGGTEAIKEVVTSLPPNCPPVVVVQHIPESFSASYAARVDALSALRVYEARDGQKIEAGCVYIAPGHSHLRLRKVAQGWQCQLSQDAHVNRHRPSVEVLFDSVSECFGDKAVGVLLTGMGSDGAQALLRMRERGAVTLAQDEDSSIVWGMPGAAVKLGAAQKVLPLARIATEIIQVAYRQT